MNTGILIALPVFLFLNYMAVSESLPNFIDAASLLVVLGGAISFALCGSGGWSSDSRLSNAAEGAVIAGWLGALYAVQLAVAATANGFARRSGRSEPWRRDKPHLLADVGACRRGGKKHCPPHHRFGTRNNVLWPADCEQRRRSRALAGGARLACTCSIR